MIIGFGLFQGLLGRINEILDRFVNDPSNRAIEALTPFLAVAFTIILLWYAYKVMFGQLEQPVSKLITKCLTWSIVMSLALTTGNYQKYISHFIRDLPNDVAAAIAPGNDATDGRLGSLLDTIMDGGTSKAKEAFGSGFSIKALALGRVKMYMFFGFMILIETIVLTTIGFLMLMMASVAVSFLAALGPFFIAAYMFDSTRNFFWLWVNQICYWVVYMIMFALFASFGMNVYDSYLRTLDIVADSWIITCVAVTILGFFTAFIFFWIPRIASALTGGGGQSMLGTIGTAISTAANIVSVASGVGAVAGQAVKATGEIVRTINALNNTGSSTGANSVKQVTHQPAKGHARK